MTYEVRFTRAAARQFSGLPRAILQAPYIHAGCNTEPQPSLDEFPPFVDSAIDPPVK